MRKFLPSCYCRIHVCCPLWMFQMICKRHSGGKLLPAETAPQISQHAQSYQCVEQFPHGLQLSIQGFLESTQLLPVATLVSVSRNHRLTLPRSWSGAFFPRAPSLDQRGLTRTALRCPTIGHGCSPILCSARFQNFPRGQKAEQMRCC